ncbi:MAG: flavodoxin-dependent (E)-4-hydroxy-3-methylbut-2-enyl-diphosphate synthase [Clostridiales Family XIII bacterium]|jgi:(E)-4-hydroxy-3-methylbut-2-enyl-diphosphate synthase|nr:flavodoxin-dependent (E)-4-hydroxy-3-methylbut-2-enyl-diphosphate synthase [Clostridiales Family XIII bacterium]
MKRRTTSQVICGGVPIGGGAPISIQSMTNTDTRDVRSTLEQIGRLADAGCHIARCAVPDMEAAEAIGRIKAGSPLPIVADIHFDHRLALAAMEAGADKIRINPGNIGGPDAARAVARMAMERGLPIRVGVNAGSLGREALEKHGGATAAALAESALASVALLEGEGFRDIVVSMKASDLAVNHEAHIMAAAACPYPFHIGVTEAGLGESGEIKSAIGIGALLLAGIGDTLRVSLTGDPVREARAAAAVLKALNIGGGNVNVVSCPTCGRCRVDLESLARQVDARARDMERRARARGEGRSISIAVMGCAVNGPGEAAHADIGVACGDGRGVIFCGGRAVRTVAEGDIVEELMKGAEGLWTD